MASVVKLVLIDCNTGDDILVSLKMMEVMPAKKMLMSKLAEALGDTGRILVRESGTEPVVRVMVEAPDHDTCQKYVSQVVEVIKNKGYVV